MRFVEILIIIVIIAIAIIGSVVYSVSNSPIWEATSVNEVVEKLEPPPANDKLLFIKLKNEQFSLAYVIDRQHNLCFLIGHAGLISISCEPFKNEILPNH